MNSEIQKQALRCLISAALALCFFWQSAWGFVVFDPSNYKQNVITAVKTAATYKKMLASYQKQLEQFATLKQQFATIKEHYGLDQRNLRELQNLAKLLLTNQMAINTFAAQSEFALLERLDPASADYPSKRDEILAAFYQRPLLPETIVSQFQGILSSKELKPLLDKIERQDKHYRRYLDVLAQSANDRQLQARRKEAILNYQKTLSSLGQESELKSLQTNGAQINLLLQQQEKALSSLAQLNQLHMEAHARQVSARAEDVANETRRLLKAARASAPAPGPARWGDL